MFKSVRLRQEREWYEIRDTLCGRNNTIFNNVMLAFELAMKSKHPKAKWLVSVLEKVDNLSDSSKVQHALQTCDNGKNLEAQLFAGEFNSYSASVWETRDALAQNGCVLAGVWNFYDRNGFMQWLQKTKIWIEIVILCYGPNFLFKTKKQCGF